MAPIFYSVKKRTKNGSVKKRTKSGRIKKDRKRKDADVYIECDN